MTDAPANIPKPMKNIAAPPPGPADRRCQLVVQNMTNYAVIVLDEGGCVAHWSAGAQHVFGWEPSEVIGRTIDFIYEPQDVTEGKPQAEMALPIDRDRLEYEALRVRKDGSPFWASVLWTDLWDQPGQTLGMACIISDITARKRAELLDRDRRQVLELMARNEPSGRVLLRLAVLTEQHCQGIRTSISVLADGKICTVAAPRLEKTWLEALDAHGVRLAADLLADQSDPANPMRISDVSHDPTWTVLQPAAATASIQTCWSVPITSGSGDLLGMLFAYSDSARPAAPTRFEQETIQLAVQLAGFTLEHEQLTNQLSRQAQHDSLTGLPNRMCFEDRLHLCLTQAQAHR